MSAGFIGLAFSVLFLLAAVTTIIALTNRAFAGHTAAAQQGHAAPVPAGQAAPAGQTTAPAGGQTPPAQRDTAAAAHAPGAH